MDEDIRVSDSNYDDNKAGNSCEHINIFWFMTPLMPHQKLNIKPRVPWCISLL